MLPASVLLAAALLAVAPTTPVRGVAVVELFTSEGCSSCPPADDLLRAIDADARRARTPIYPLSFHVDYWDDLGWKDPYSAAAFTDRQRDYVRALRSGGPYTPQMVVNGREAFVGSRRGQADVAIREALARPAPCEVTIESASPGRRTISVGYRVHGAAAKDRVIAALVERGIERRVGAGENKGRTLHHEDVVRTLVTSAASSGAGRLELAVPRGLDLGRASIVVFVQRPATLEITGAARTDLSAR